MKFLISLVAVGILAIASPQVSQAAFSQKTDGEWITVSGKVTKVAPRAFNLKSGKRTILIEMDDYDWDADGFKLVKGDQVVVSGRVDHDFLEKKKVEAQSVYVKSLNSYFYANSDDEEGAPYIISTTYSYMPKLPENAYVDVKGKVVKIEGRDMTVNTGVRLLKVDTDELIYNPMDNKGYTQLDVGDRVRVSGTVEDDIFEGKEVSANFVTELK